MNRWLTGPPRLSDNAPLSEFLVSYAFLRLPPIPALGDEQDRQRYICIYNFSRLLRSSAAALGLAMFGALIIPLMHASPPSWSAEFLIKWPLNARLVEQLNTFHALTGSQGYDPDSTMVLITSAGLASAVWLGWRLGRCIAEARRTDRFKWNMPLFPFVAGAIVAWTALLIGPSVNPPFFGPSFSDSIVALCLKESIFLSFGYWSLGMLAFMFTTKIRSARV